MIIQISVHKLFPHRTVWEPTRCPHRTAWALMWCPCSAHGHRCGHSLKTVWAPAMAWAPHECPHRTVWAPRRFPYRTVWAQNTYCLFSDFGGSISPDFFAFSDRLDISSLIMIK